MDVVRASREGLASTNNFTTWRFSGATGFPEA
jgi:hypothetical protein